MAVAREQTPLRLLLVEDSPRDAKLLLRELQRGGYDVEVLRVETPEDLRRALDEGPWDLVVSDYSMPRFSGPDALRVVKEIDRDIPFIIASGAIGEDLAVAAKKSGADDYLLKDNLARLVPAIQRELREAEGRRQRRRAELALRESSEMLLYQARHDSVTGLPNRSLLVEAIGAQASRADTASLAVVMLSLHRFKDINEIFGHDYGDLLLRMVGERISQRLAPGDLVARIGGDDFALMLVGVDADLARRSVHRVLFALDEPFALDGQSIHVSASAGIAVYPEHGADAPTLLRRADVAMHAAKEAGLSTTVYSHDIDPYREERRVLISDLRRAIDLEQLALHYQPKVELGSGRVAGVEALLRWNHPDMGSVLPGEFIQAAERSGVIEQLTPLVLGSALRQARDWHAAGFDLGVAVNISMRSLRDRTLSDLVAKHLMLTGAEPSWLTIEVTESAVLHDHETAREILQDLHAMNVRIAIDDFGTGYSSLTHLQQLPVDEIKVDRSFVTNILADAGTASIARSVIQLAHSLGVRVVAEGVEGLDVLIWLMKHGCDAVQGYVISPPLGPCEFVEWLQPWSESAWPGRFSATEQTA